MSKNTFKRAAVTAGLVGAVAFTAVGSAQAAPSQYVRSPQMAVTEDDAQWYQGTIVAFTDDFLEVDVDGTIAEFDLTKGADWFGHMMIGATANIKAKIVDGVYVAVAVIAR
ncbi:hypothetical protein J2Z21_008672 [Streptomyces griseochromogenes]|uniref:DUF5666 domain-containing protein n=1 Tax=Streptomyces griseochromogenes TaxID=68214 RepID=A0A1B1B075_9ACTN|nr:hypothetical protein [Streptomyces griseochromogenes]ANP52243.1 hypothetical protein AVL59_24220 [Streptomyces griseochromogenes]MBP2055656.1 hypothetical protein [Streptomyces griseochromogenes]